MFVSETAQVDLRSEQCVSPCLTYSNRVVVLPVPAKARTSITWSQGLTLVHFSAGRGHSLRIHYVVHTPSVTQTAQVELRGVRPCLVFAQVGGHDGVLLVGQPRRQRVRRVGQTSRRSPLTVLLPPGRHLQIPRGGFQVRQPGVRA